MIYLWIKVLVVFFWCGVFCFEDVWLCLSLCIFLICIWDCCWILNCCSFFLNVWLVIWIGVVIVLRLWVEIIWSNWLRICLCSFLIMWWWLVIWWILFFFWRLLECEFGWKNWVFWIEFLLFWVIMMFMYLVLFVRFVWCGGFICVVMMFNLFLLKRFDWKWCFFMFGGGVGLCWLGWWWDVLVCFGL